MQNKENEWFSSRSRERERDGREAKGGGGDGLLSDEPGGGAVGRREPRRGWRRCNRHPRPVQQGRDAPEEPLGRHRISSVTNYITQTSSIILN